MADESDAVGLVTRYYLYRATDAVGFYAPVQTVFLLARGLDFVQVGTLDAVFLAAGVVGEVPTGYVGDRIGWRNSLLAGTALVSLTLVGIGLADSFYAFVGLFSLWALGYAFISGSDDAWLYDALDRRLDADEFARVRGRGSSVSLVVGATAAVVGSHLADLDLAYPFFAAALGTALGVPVLLSFPTADDAGDADDQLRVRSAGSLVLRRFTEPGLRSFLACYALLVGTIGLVYIFTQPIGTDLGVEVADLGWLYAGFSLVSAAASYRVDAVRSVVGTDRWFVVAPFVVGGLYLGIGLVPLVALPTFFVARAVASVTRPLASQFVNDAVESVGRATVLSAVSMVVACASIVARVGGGWLADAHSPFVAMAIAGGLLVGTTTLVLAWESPVGVGSGAVSWTATRDRE